MSNNPKRLLIIRLSAMGDVAMLVPILCALRRTYPQLEVSVLTQPRLAPILEQVDGVHCLTAKIKTTHRHPTGLYQLSKELNQHGFDYIADLHHVLRSRILRTLLKGKKAHINKGRKAKKRLITHPDYFKQLPTTFERYQKVLHELGYPITLTSTDVIPKQILDQEVTDHLGTGQQKWIGIAPFAAHASKSMTDRMLSELIQSLTTKKTNRYLLFGGGQSEIERLQLIAKNNENTTLIAGQFTFGQELSLISQLDAMIAMDSGNAHLAAMYGVPVISLWGCTHPFAGFAPFDQPMANQLLADRTQFSQIPTSIYGNKWPEGYELAIESIPVAKIEQRLQEVLES